MRSIPHIHASISGLRSEHKEKERNDSDLLRSLKGWLMVGLTFMFVSLYAAALTGWLRPISDVTMIARLEPIIFVIIGYFFARVPAQHAESVLKDEIERQANDIEAARIVSDQLSLSTGVLKVRIHNAKTALSKPVTVSELGENVVAIYENNAAIARRILERENSQ